MWFKNLILYRLAEPFRPDPEQVATAIAEHAVRPCGGLDPFTYGWAPPLGKLADELVHAANGYILLCARRNERLLPASVVRDSVDERVAQLEAEYARPVRGKERRRIRDDVTFELLPRAFVRGADTHAYIAPRERWLVVNTTSAKRAEELVLLLSHSLGGLELDGYTAAVSPAAEMTRWLQGDPLPDGFSLQADCEFRDPADVRAVVRCQNQDLSSDEIRGHLRANKQVHRLALGFEERLSLVLSADLSIRRLRFEAVEEFDQVDAADELAQRDANFAFMTGELARLLERLDEVFGVEKSLAT